jgi:uncharacterized membrane protein
VIPAIPAEAKAAAAALPAISQPSTVSIALSDEMKQIAASKEKEIGVDAGT